jgi:hypothetical protein
MRLRCARGPVGAVCAAGRDMAASNMLMAYTDALSPLRGALHAHVATTSPQPAYVVSLYLHLSAPW